MSKVAALLAAFPYTGQRKFASCVRTIPLRKYPYMLFYCVEADEVVILSIRHTARRPARETDWT
jgi:plasmid stabilization system protein ParE